jgi:hypothetical protein
MGTRRSKKDQAIAPPQSPVVCALLILANKNMEDFNRGHGGPLKIFLA